ncbi:MAG: hypothetical protein K0S39_3720 [Paenibacillus sp.]|jgi:hypothetical protein|nr:hypothetical protein [Paenibacillus sp.]
MNSTPYENKKKLTFTLFSYLLSAVTGALGLVNWAGLRDFLMTVVTHSSISRWSWHAIDNFSFILFGMIWLSFVLFTQFYLAKSTHMANLWSRVTFLLGIQVLLLLVCQTVPVVLGIVNYNSFQLIVHGTEGLLGIGLLYLGRYLKVRRQRPSEE